MIADRPFSLVLAGVDGSERASEAARQAARLASAVRAQLIVAYVIEDRPYEEGTPNARSRPRAPPRGRPASTRRRGS